jgi:predicted ATP-dependent endonuclease of OLD family
MYISKIKVQNFRLLKNSVLDLENQKDLSLLIGRNNSGKTSFIVLFEKFLKSDGNKFNFDDFPISLRQNIFDFNENTDELEMSIKLIFEITYDKDDSLENLSDLILDLDPASNKVNILFECSINKQKLLADLVNVDDKLKKRFLKKNLSSYLNQPKIFVFENEEDLEASNRYKIIEKDRKTIEKLINFQVIHAKRGVSSSESSGASKQVLSNITTNYFNKKTENELADNKLDDINSNLLEMDNLLGASYDTFFGDFLKQAKEFLAISDLKVISDLESKEILSYHSKVVYGAEEDVLPEHLNGLGYMNILYLLLQLEIKKEYLLEGKKEINLLFIEEPEAHTHPQMQTIFIRKIKELLGDVDSLQTFITTHSSHIVKNCDFKDIRYFSYDDDNKNIEVKNFYSELEKKYDNEKDNFKFLNQYLSIASAELFFAEKIIFIEGVTEGLLLPFFMNEYDKSCGDEKLKLSSQNITVLEVGANAKAFQHFIDFLSIQTLVITDIDTTLKTTNDKGHIVYQASEVKSSTHTSNATIREFLDSPDFSEVEKFVDWFEKLKSCTLHDEDSTIKIVYQSSESGYHGRSFEDAFISLNKDLLIEQSDYLEKNGLATDFKTEIESSEDYYNITENILKKKSEFASAILWLALTSQVSWNVPAYIKEGLQWIANKK